VSELNITFVYYYIFYKCSAESTATLFRGNTLATTLMDQYMKMTSTLFVHTAVQGVVNRIMESKQPCEVYNPTLALTVIIENKTDI